MVSLLSILSRALSALITFVIAFIVMKVAVSFATKIVKKSKFDALIQDFILSAVKALCWVFVIFAVIASLGIDTSSILAVLAACGMAIALALKDSLGNIAGGVLVVTSKNFGKGDFIEVAGKAGVVQEVGLLYTTILTPDNQVVTIPNGALTTNAVSNYNREGTRRVDMAFGIAYKADVNKAKEVIAAMAAQDERVLQTPAPFVAVDKYEQGAVVFAFRVYCKASDYWDVKFALQDKVKDTLTAAGIAAPMGRTVVELEK